jgi:hypothetical protein
MTCLKLEATTESLAFTGQALDAKDIEAETVGAVIKRFSSDAVKHSVILSIDR